MATAAAGRIAAASPASHNFLKAANRQIPAKLLARAVLPAIVGTSALLLAALTATYLGERSNITFELRLVLSSAALGFVTGVSTGGVLGAAAHQRYLFTARLACFAFIILLAGALPLDLTGNVYPLLLIVGAGLSMPLLSYATGTVFGRAAHAPVHWFRSGIKHRSTRSRC